MDGKYSGVSNYVKRIFGPQISHTIQIYVRPPRADKNELKQFIYDWCLLPSSANEFYRKVSNIGHNKSQNLNVSRLVVFAQSIEAECQADNEDVVGAAPTGDAPTTSEWSWI